MHEPTRDYCYGYMRGYQALTRVEHFASNRPEIYAQRPEEPLAPEVFAALLDGRSVEHRRGFCAGFSRFCADAEDALEAAQRALNATQGA